MTRSDTGRRHAGRRSTGAAAAVLALAALTAAGCSSSSSSSSSAPASTAASAAASTSTGASSSASGTPIAVGAMGSFTGAGAGSTADAKTVFQDWVDATNAAGGINGHPIQATILDDQNTPSVAVANATKLVQQDHVKVIFDLSDDLESTWAKIVDTAQVPVLGQSEGPAFGTDANFYPTGTTVEPLIWGELKAASVAKVSKISGLYCAEIASCAQTVPLITALGKTVGISLAYSASISSTASSYTAQCLGSKNAGANGVTVAAASEVAVSVAASCATQGYKPIYVTTAGEMTTPWLAQSALNGAIGNTQDVPWFDDSIPATKAMQAAISQVLAERADLGVVRRDGHHRLGRGHRLRHGGEDRRPDPELLAGPDHRGARHRQERDVRWHHPAADLHRRQARAGCLLVRGRHQQRQVDRAHRPQDHLHARHVTS